MRLKVATTGKTADIRLKGALTIGSAVDELHKTVSSLLMGGVRQIAVDVAGVPYADASGLGALVACRIGARAAGATLRVTGAAGKMKELLVLTCLEKLRREDVAVRDDSGRKRHARRAGAFSMAKLSAHVA